MHGFIIQKSGSNHVIFIEKELLRYINHQVPSESRLNCKGENEINSENQ